MFRSKLVPLILGCSIASSAASAADLPRTARAPIAKVKNAKKRCPFGEALPDRYTDCKNYIQWAVKAFAKVSAADLTHPMVKQARADLDKLLSYEKKWDGMRATSRKSSANRGALKREFKGLAHKHSSALEALVRGKQGKPTTVKKLRTLFEFNMSKPAELDAFAKRCESAFGPIKDGKMGRGRWDDYKKDADVACDGLKDWRKNLAKYIGVTAGQKIKGRLEHLRDSVIPKVLASGKIEAWAYDEFLASNKMIQDLTKEVQPSYDAAKLKVPSDLFAGYPEMRKLLKSAVSKASKKKRWNPDARHKHPGVAKAVRRVLKKRGFAVRKYGAVGVAWTIKRNAFGRPVERTRFVGVLAKKGGEGHCRVYMVKASEDYNGRRYGKTQIYNNGFVDFTISRCN